MSMSLYQNQYRIDVHFKKSTLYSSDVATGLEGRRSSAHDEAGGDAECLAGPGPLQQRPSELLHEGEEKTRTADLLRVLILSREH